MGSLNTAYLPGVGKIIDPKPEHYRKAIRFLVNHEHEPLPKAHALLATLRRIEWTRRETELPAALRKGRA